MPNYDETWSPAQGQKDESIYYYKSIVDTILRAKMASHWYVSYLLQIVLISVKFLCWILCFCSCNCKVIKMISTCSVFADNALTLVRLVKFITWERKIVMDNRYFETLCSNGNLVVYGDTLVDLNVLHKLLKGFSSDDGTNSVKSMQQASSKYAGKKNMLARKRQAQWGQTFLQACA